MGGRGVVYSHLVLGPSSFHVSLVSHSTPLWGSLDLAQGLISAIFQLLPSTCTMFFRRETDPTEEFGCDIRRFYNGLKQERGQKNVSILQVKNQHLEIMMW